MLIPFKMEGNRKYRYLFAANKLNTNIKMVTFLDAACKIFSLGLYLMQSKHDCTAS